MAISKALSDTELKKLCPGCPITEYSDVDEKDLAECLGSSGRGFVLFVEEDSPDETTGHWLALSRRGGTVEMFDPYGAHGRGDPWFLDHTFIPPASLRALHEGMPTLQQWIHEHGFVPTANPYRFQVMKPGINTCGRHSAYRLMNSDLDIHGYKELVTAECAKQACTPDVLVTRITDGKLRG